MKPIVMSDFYAVCRNINFTAVELVHIKYNTWATLGWQLEDGGHIVWCVFSYYSDQNCLSNSTHCPSEDSARKYFYSKF